MHPIQPSELVKHLSLTDFSFSIFPHRRNIPFLTNAFVGQVHKPMAVPWLLERGAVKTVLTSNQPGFNAVNRGGNHD